MPTGHRLLVADDDHALRQVLDRALRFEGYTVDLAVDGADALSRIAALAPDLIVLDVMMPTVDGLETCRRLRRSGDRTPVLMLTARDRVTDTVAGLDAGADDYLAKPFELQELLARLRALLRRTTAAPDAIGGVLHIADLQLDPATRLVHHAGQVVELTRTEFDLLHTLLRHQNQVLTRAQLFEQVWGFDLDNSSNSLDVYIGYLRRKLEADGAPRLLQTVRGIGFVLREPAS